jgi:hypothetical protein
MNTQTRLTSRTPDIRELLEAIVARTARPIQTKPPAVATLAKGIVNWVNDNPTTEALIVEDLGRMIERCGTRGELADLALQIRMLAFTFRPDGSRTDPSQITARVLEVIDSIAFEED